MTEQKELPCPLCKKPLQVFLNGSAKCANILRGATSISEFESGSCLMAAHGIMMSIKIWEALNNRVQPAEDERVKPDIADWLKPQCQRLRYGRCTTLYCLRRGGYVGKGGPTDYSIATCEPYEIYNALSLLPVQPAQDDWIFRDAYAEFRRAIRDQLAKAGIVTNPTSLDDELIAAIATLVQPAASTEAQNERDRIVQAIRRKADEYAKDVSSVNFLHQNCVKEVADFVESLSPKSTPYNGNRDTYLEAGTNEP